MNQEIKEKWVKALRSGEYVQAEGVLYDSLQSSRGGKPAMCCLGVLENICGNTDVSAMDGLEYPGMLEITFSPEGFRNDEDKTARLLASMNDGLSSKDIKKHSFEEIADYIEKNL